MLRDASAMLAGAMGRGRWGTMAFEFLKAQKMSKSVNKSYNHSTLNVILQVNRQRDISLANNYITHNKTMTYNLQQSPSEFGK